MTALPRTLVNMVHWAALAGFGLFGCASEAADGEGMSGSKSPNASGTDQGDTPAAQDVVGTAPGSGATTGDDQTGTEPVVAPIPEQPSNVIVDDDELPPAASDCARETYEAERVTTNVYLMLDISGSMLNPVSVESELTQWGAVREAVKGFILAPESSGLTLAMNYYPIQEPRSDCSRARCANGAPCIASLCDLRFALFDQIELCVDDTPCDGLYTNEEGETYIEGCLPPGHCSEDTLDICLLDWQCPTGQTCVLEPSAICPGVNSCEQAEYASPDVALATLPTGADEFIGSLDAHEPDTFALTPTHVALAGAYSQVQDWLVTQPDSQSVMILATDGMPNGCTAEPEGPVGAFEAQATLEQLAAARQAGITTFVIGVVPDPTGIDLPAEELAALQAAIDQLSTQLDEMAVAGGTDAAFNVSVGDDTTDGFLDALGAIRGAVLPCNYEIPMPASGNVAYDRVNVELTAQGAASGQTIPQVQSQGECVQGENAWYYRTDAATGTPSRVELCPSACEAANAAVGSRIDIVLGCATIIRVR